MTQMIHPDVDRVMLTETQISEKVKRLRENQEKTGQTTQDTTRFVSFFRKSAYAVKGSRRRKKIPAAKFADGV